MFNVVYTTLKLFDMEESSSLTLMDENRIERSLKRIAHQIREDNQGEREMVIVGINHRGYAVATMLKEYLSSLSENDIVCFQLWVGDENGMEERPALSNKYLLLVDDVIFSGTTMFRALNLLAKEKLPSEIHTVTLVDRGHRKFPVFAQFVGMDLPTKLDEHVQVDIQDQKATKVVLSQSMY